LYEKNQPIFVHRLDIQRWPMRNSKSPSRMLPSDCMPSASCARYLSTTTSYGH